MTPQAARLDLHKLVPVVGLPILTTACPILRPVVEYRLASMVQARLIVVILHYKKLLAQRTPFLAFWQYLLLLGWLLLRFFRFLRLFHVGVNIIELRLSGSLLCFQLCLSCSYNGRRQELRAFGFLCAVRAAKTARDFHEIVPIVGLSLATTCPVFIAIPEHGAEPMMVACLGTILLLTISDLAAIVLAGEERRVVFLFSPSFLLVARRRPSLDVYMLLINEGDFYDIVRVELGAPSVLCMNLLWIERVLRKLPVVVFNEEVRHFVHGPAPPLFRDFHAQLQLPLFRAVIVMKCDLQRHGESEQ
mmetsp:Transcript_2153/g.3251  ORF Transcript_2153/g.3251 Transcript_2153/m.3251 type:complete len:304 (-) Transcript_2153:89-1000(-)